MNFSQTGKNMKLFIIKLFLGLSILSACEKTDQGRERFINEIENITDFDVSIRTYGGKRLLIQLDIKAKSTYTQDTLSFDLGTNYNKNFLLSGSLNITADSAVIEFSDGKYLSSICKFFQTPMGPCPQDEISLLNGDWNNELVISEGSLKIFKSKFVINTAHYDAAE